eukprot:g16651.t1
MSGVQNPPPFRSEREQTHPKSAEEAPEDETWRSFFALDVPGGAAKVGAMRGSGGAAGAPAYARAPSPEIEKTSSLRPRQSAAAVGKKLGCSVNAGGSAAEDAVGSAAISSNNATTINADTEGPIGEVSFDVSGKSQFVIEATETSDDKPQLGSASVVVSGADKDDVVLQPLCDKMSAAMGTSQAAANAGHCANESQRPCLDLDLVAKYVDKREQLQNSPPLDGQDVQKKKEVRNPLYAGKPSAEEFRYIKDSLAELDIPGTTAEVKTMSLQERSDTIKICLELSERSRAWVYGKQKEGHGLEKRVGEMQAMGAALRKLKALCHAHIHKAAKRAAKQKQASRREVSTSKMLSKKVAQRGAQGAAWKKPAYSLQAVEELTYEVIGGQKLDVTQLMQLPHDGNIHVASLKVLALIRVTDKDEEGEGGMKKSDKFDNVGAFLQAQEESGSGFHPQEIANAIIKGEAGSEGSELLACSLDYSNQTIEINSRPYFSDCLFLLKTGMREMVLMVQWLACMQWLVFRSTCATATKLMLSTWDDILHQCKGRPLYPLKEWKALIATIGSAVCGAAMRISGGGSFFQMRTIAGNKRTRQERAGATSSAAAGSPDAPDAKKVAPGSEQRGEGGAFPYASNANQHAAYAGEQEQLEEGEESAAKLLNMDEGAHEEEMGTHQQSESQSTVDDEERLPAKQMTEVGLENNDKTRRVQLLRGCRAGGNVGLSGGSFADENANTDCRFFLKPLLKAGRLECENGCDKDLGNAVAGAWKEVGATKKTSSCGELFKKGAEVLTPRAGLYVLTALLPAVPFFAMLAQFLQLITALSLWGVDLDGVLALQAPLLAALQQAEAKTQLQGLLLHCRLFSKIKVPGLTQMRHLFAKCQPLDELKKHFATICKLPNKVGAV